MTYKEKKKLDDKELILKLEENKKEYIDKKLAILNNQLQDTSVLNKIKKDTARIKTLLNERKQS
jgi:ribosomal protein L29